MRIALSSRCKALAYSLDDWTAENLALNEGKPPVACPCCARIGFYAPRRAEDGRHYRACKYCGFWQDIEKPPHEIIRFECAGTDHWYADWKEPHESWTCPQCQRIFRPRDSVAWPVDDATHPWRAAPTSGSQAEYQQFWEMYGCEAPVFGIP